MLKFLSVSITLVFDRRVLHRINSNNEFKNKESLEKTMSWLYDVAGFVDR